MLICSRVLLGVQASQIQAERFWKKRFAWAEEQEIGLTVIIAVVNVENSNFASVVLDDAGVSCCWENLAFASEDAN